MGNIRFISLVALMGLFLASQASAQTVSQEQDYPFTKIRIFLADGADFRIDPDDIFREFNGHPVGEQTADIKRVAWLTDFADEVLDGYHEFEVLRSHDLLLDREPDSGEIIVRGLLHLGIERYKDIRIPAAITALEQGAEAAMAEFLDILSPDLVSDIYLYLGLSRLENGEDALAHVAFKNMFTVTPGKHFQKGYYPKDAEDAITKAAIDVSKSHQGDVLLSSALRADRFMKRHKVNAVCTLSISKALGSKKEVEIRLFERPKRGKGLVSLSVMDRFALDEGTQERISKTLTAWASCADVPSRRLEKRKTPRFFMDTSAAYAVYLKTPTRRHFHNAGLGIGLAWHAAEGLDILGRLNVFNSFPDPYEDLISDFWSVQAIAGAGYSLIANWGRVFVHFGLEMNYLSDFASTTDPQCKFWPNDLSRCDRSRIKNPSILLGINGTVGFNITISGPISLNFQTGVSAYYYSNKGVPDINFPYLLELGFGYAFF
jgi:hypothetical protein